MLYSFSATARSLEPAVTHAVQQKTRAIDLFLKDSKVVAELKKQADDGYKQVAVEAAPFSFAYGDEGMHTRFLVTTWFGKAQEYGWAATFVSAVVSTDGFAATKVALVDQKETQAALQKLVVKE